MKTRVVVNMLGVVVVILLAGLFGAFRGPWIHDDELAQAQAEMNADNANAIVAKAHDAPVVLPATSPPSFEYLSSVRTDPDRFEILVQHQRVLYALCVGGPHTQAPDAASDGDSDAEQQSECDAQTAQVVRTTTVDGRPVRIARVYLTDPSDLSTVDVTGRDPSAGDAAVLSYWLGVPLGDHVPSWVEALARSTPSTP